MNGGRADEGQSGDWMDRLIDASLHELHGQKPPDLSSRVLSALEQEQAQEQAPPGPLPIVRGPRTTRRRPGVRGLLGLAAALLIAGVAFVLWRETADGVHGRPDQVIARLELTVLRGTLVCSEEGAGGGVSHHAAGSVVSFSARAGNRLHCVAPCEALVGPFGIFAAGQQSELEVRSMEFSWKGGVVAASSLTVAVVAGVVTWHSLGRSETAKAGEVLRLQAADNAADGAAAVAAENDRLRRRLQQLEQEVEALKQEPERDAVASALVAPPPPPPEVEGDAMVFTDPAYAAALAGIDWKLMGGVTKEMGPLLAQLVEAMKNGEEIPPELGVQIQELNMKLVAQVPALLKAGLPGFGPNGAYTHPLVVANVLASTLGAAGQPLSESQRTQIDGLVRTFSLESQAIAAGPREFEIEQLLVEAEMKDRFFREIASHLSPEQGQTMHPEGVSSYDGADLFSSGLMTRPYTEGVPASNAAEFARLASNRLGEDLGLDEAAAAKVRAVVERVTAAAPELWGDPVDGAERDLRMLKSGRTKAALRRQIEVMREIQRQVPMSPDQLKKFRAMKGVLVPLPR